MKIPAITSWLTRFVLILLLAPGGAMANDVWDDVEHHTTDSDGVRIHYVSLGEGPLVVLVHGFPDFWYSWRAQMRALADAGYRAVAMDQRGYNGSGQPDGIEQYAMPLLVGDVAAVIGAEGQSRAVVVGHDWGGAVAWNVAMQWPDLVELLVILNLPHPAGLARELMNNPEQRRNSEYAFNFQQPDAHKQLTAEGLAGWVQDPAARARYVEAFRRSSFEGMLNYYRANYPRPEARELAGASGFPAVKVPVLMFHGLDDQALLPGALNGTWEWVEKDLTLVTVPGAGHFVQQDAPDIVSGTMVDWIARRR